MVPNGTLIGRTTLKESDSVFWSLQLHDDQILCHSLHPAFFTALQAGGNGKGPTRCFREGSQTWGNRQCTYKNHVSRGMMKRECNDVGESGRKEVPVSAVSALLQRVTLLLVVLLIAGGLFMFTYKSTQFNAQGFVLVLCASFLGGIRWTLTQILMQKAELGMWGVRRGWWCW